MLIDKSELLKAYDAAHKGPPGGARKLIEEAPAVDAVPLDKLCEWLELYATMDCDGCREAFGSCEDEENQEVSVCNSRKRWKAMLTKWKERLDADRPRYSSRPD